ncbi:hypothetical protein ACFVY4_26765 [Streptomyces sp. NPDC058299]|uniref:hypothetical protein n=1 Tax=Streptomyces sp. NPDC058299 TaxID=3346435 RepID=UPI0036E674B4
MSSTDSTFYHWMCRHARAMGWDLDDHDNRKVLWVWSALAATSGLSDEQTAQLARGLGVTPEEVMAAYEPEMRQAAMDELLAQPDLAALDTQLDQIAHPPAD